MSSPALPSAAGLASFSPEEPQSTALSIELELPRAERALERGSWESALSSGAQELIRRLSREHFSQENLNERAYEVLDVLSAEIPFFETVREAAREKGYRFEAVGDNTPVEIRDYFRERGAFAATEKTSNRIYIEFDALESALEASKGRQSFGSGLTELLAKEGVHIVFDEIRTADDARVRNGPTRGIANITALAEISDREAERNGSPTELETQLRADAVEDMSSMIAGALAGLTADRDVKSGLSPDSLPNRNLSEETLVRALLTSVDNAVADSMPLLESVDSRSRRAVMSRQVTYAFSGRMEKAVTEQLRALRILDEHGELRKLDIAGAMRTTVA